MGYAGLNIDDLRRELARFRIEMEVVEDDRTGDHCVVRLTGMRYPHKKALLYYENMGIEPRYAALRFDTSPGDEGELPSRAFRQGQGVAGDDHLTIQGRRADDVHRLAEWAAERYDQQRSQQ